MLSWIRDGVRYSLDDGTYCWHLGDRGWGMAPVRRLAERGPLQHGETDRGFRLDPRFGTLILELDAATHPGLRSKRETLVALFAPSEAARDGALEWDLDGRLRRIDCHYAGDMDFSSQDREGWTLRVAVTLKASDPTFYDPAGAAVTFNLGAGGGGFLVPMEVPHAVGASTIDTALALHYAGNWISYPNLIRVVGPIDNAVITNETTGEKLDFTGLLLGAGERRDIDLRYGHKTVLDENGANSIADLSSDSDLATWHLRPGTNSIRATGINAAAATRIDINYFVRYLGV